MTFFDLLHMFFSGTNLALIGAALAVILPCIGSAKGVGMVGEATAGVIAEDPTKFGKALILQALPGTQGIYGFITAFIAVIIKLNVLSGNFVTLTDAQGLFFLSACLPIAVVGYFSAIKQARVACAGVNILAKRPDQFIKGVISSALVETYAIFALLVSLLMILSFQL